MDTITHALSGALLARATAPAVGGRLTLRARLVSGTLTAAFPDSDFVIRFFTDPLTYLNLHRGVTHSLVMLPLWAVLLSMLYAAFSRGRYHWRDFVWVTAACLAIHIAGDVITTYGTKIFMPLSHWRATVPTTFIIDLFVTGILVLGLLAGSVTMNTRRTARIAFVVLASYIGLQGYLLQRAEQLAADYAHAQGLQDASIHALPQPLSPFNWKLLVVTPQEYHVSYVNLRRDQAVKASDSDGFFRRVEAIYQPVPKQQWETHARFGNRPELWSLVEKAWHMENFDGFRRFAVFPMLYEVQQDNPDITCVWFTDLRFVIKAMTPPFRFGMCGNRQDTFWKMKRLSRFD
jgi:inner membrane protein